MTTTEELAQALADHFHPPATYERFKKDWRKWPEDEQTEIYTERCGPDHSPFVRFLDSDGEYSFRSLTYRELSEAVLTILKEGVA